MMVGTHRYGLTDIVTTGTPALDVGALRRVLAVRHDARELPQPFPELWAAPTREP